ncbi:MAG: sterol desaturase family protein [Isosphaeraceae bacterium]
MVWSWLRILLDAAVLFVLATFLFDVIHLLLHRWKASRWGLLRRLASLHDAHHVFCDRQLVYHDDRVAPNIILHVIPEYATQMAVATFGFLVAGFWSVVIVMAAFTAIFVAVLFLKGKDRNHRSLGILRPAHATALVTPEYHALHHVYPDCYLSSYTTALDRLLGTACQVRGRRVALTGSTGAFGAPLKELLEAQGAEVRPIRSGTDFRPGDFTGADAALAWADILVLAHGAKGEQADWANHESFLELIGRFKRLARDRQVPPEVWAVGSEIECHPAFGLPELQSYARSKRAFAREASRFMDDPDILYRHIVPSAFRSKMGPGLMGGKTAAAWALFLIRRGFRYVPVTYTGIALVNFVPFRLRGLLSPPISSQRELLYDHQEMPAVP